MTEHATGDLLQRLDAEEREAGEPRGRPGRSGGTRTPVPAGSPFLIMTRDEAIPVLNQVLAVLATRTIRGIPTEVQLDRSDALPVACVLAADNMTLIRVSLCTERVTRLGPERMQAVCDAVATAIAC